MGGGHLHVGEFRPYQPPMLGQILPHQHVVTVQAYLVF